MRPPTRKLLPALTFVPALFAFVACATESTSSPVASEGGDAAVDAVAAQDVVAEASNEDHSFTVDGSSVTKIAYVEHAFGGLMYCAEFYERLTFDLTAKNVRVETCLDTSADAGTKSDETRALTDANIAAAREVLAKLRLRPMGECTGWDGTNRVLSLEAPDRTLAISNYANCSPGVPRDTLATEGFFDVHAKIYELAGLPEPHRLN